MTIFKTFLKVLWKNKWIVLLYSAILIFFGCFNMQNSEQSNLFTANKPDIYIINEDKENKITEAFVNYLEENCNIIELKNQENVKDALFYRDINYLIIIKENFGKQFLRGIKSEIEIQKTGDYNSSLAEMIVNRFINTANIYRNYFQTEELVIAKTKETLEKKTTIQLETNLDTSKVNKMVYYYNFANYSILAGCVYVICLILSSFKEQTIYKKTLVSCIDIKKYNRYLLLSNSIFAIAIWLLYVACSFFLIGKIMWSVHGLLCIINSFIFTLCACSIAFLIGTLLKDKNAINGIVNVVSLGSSFLCGSFVPVEYLPNTVLNIAHILPSYYFINNNEFLKTLEIINKNTLIPFIKNIIIIIGFIFLFIIMTNCISKNQKQIS